MRARVENFCANRREHSTDLHYPRLAAIPVYLMRSHFTRYGNARVGEASATISEITLRVELPGRYTDNGNPFPWNRCSPSPLWGTAA